tara:strand:- start:430 stop:612 length:183 start_codon:yes stop_codon:yes gene_type:complete
VNAEKIIKEIPKLSPQDQRKVAEYLFQLLNAEEDEVAVQEDSESNTWFDTLPTLDPNEKG